MTAHSTSAGAPALRRILPVLYIGVFMAALDTAVIGPAIPALREAFNVDNREVGLVMIVFILFSLSSTALMANLSDRHGRRPVYLGGVAAFALGSLIIALAPRFWMILLGRVIQGIGAGGIIPSASAVIGDLVPIERQGHALGMIGAVYGMAFVLGPPLAALLMVALSWHWIFLANLPIAAVILVLGARVIPARHRAGTLPPLDWAGIVAVFTLLSALVLAITRVADSFTGLVLWPWLLGVVVALTVAVVAVERRAARPMIPLSLFANGQLALAFVLTVGAGFGMGAVVFLTSIATLAYGVAANKVGFVLLPLVVCSMVGSMGSGRLLNRLGSRALLLISFALMAAGYAASAVMRFGLGGFLVASIPIGLGLGVAVGGALRSIAIDESPPELRGTAQGLINIFNAIGTLLSAAAIGAIADFRGGGAAGFGIAYLVIAALMVAMLVATLRLKAGGRLSHVAPRAATH